MISETRERFLRAIVAVVPVEQIAEIHFFQPIRQGGVESGVAVIAAGDAEPTAAPPEDAPGELAPARAGMPDEVAESAAADLSHDAASGQEPADGAHEAYVVRTPEEPAGDTAALEAEPEAAAAADAESAPELTRIPPPEPHDHPPAEPLVADVSAGDETERRATAEGEAAEGGAAGDAAAARRQPAPGAASRVAEPSMTDDIPTTAVLDDLASGEELEGAEWVDEPATDDEPAPRRFTVLTARYRLVLKGPDRGKWEAAVVAEADAPLLTVEAVVRGVQRRAGDVDEPERMSGDEVRREISRMDAAAETLRRPVGARAS